LLKIFTASQVAVGLSPTTVTDKIIRAERCHDERMRHRSYLPRRRVLEVAYHLRMLVVQTYRGSWNYLVMIMLPIEKSNDFTLHELGERVLQTSYQRHRLMFSKAAESLGCNAARNYLDVIRVNRRWCKPEIEMAR
jgi:hypothetical protein